MVCYDLCVTDKGPTPAPTLAEQTAWRECARLQAENERLKRMLLAAWELLKQAGVFDQDGVS